MPRRICQYTKTSDTNKAVVTQSQEVFYNKDSLFLLYLLVVEIINRDTNFIQQECFYVEFDEIVSNLNSSCLCKPKQYK